MLLFCLSRLNTAKISLRFTWIAAFILYTYAMKPVIQRPKYLEAHSNAWQLDGLLEAENNIFDYLYTLWKRSLKVFIKLTLHWKLVHILLCYCCWTPLCSSGMRTFLNVGHAVFIYKHLQFTHFATKNKGWRILITLKSLQRTELREPAYTFKCVQIKLNVFYSFT